MGTRLTIEAVGIERADRNLAKVDRVLALAARRALLRTATTAIKLGAQQIGSELNLRRRYIRRKLKLRKRPRLDDLEAIISARKDPILLTRYDARQLVKPAPGAQGSALRGIPAGYKAAGISVKVKRRGRRRKMPGAFYVPLGTRKLESGETETILGVAIRPPGSKRRFRVLYGPSIDQAWRSVRRDVLEKVRPIFEQRFAREAKARLKGIV